MRKIFLLFVFVFAVGMAGKAEEPSTSGIWTNYRAEAFSCVDTEKKTLTITNAGELALLAYNVFESGEYRDYNITLDADLDMSGHYWIPIGLSFTDYEFTGTFDGQGHTISNLDIWVKQQKDDEYDLGADVTYSGNVAGLFGKIGSGGIVKDVFVSGPYVGVKNPFPSTIYIGGIAGINAGTIVGCGNAAVIKNYDSSARAGGIAGENNGIIQNCYNIGEVYSSNNDMSNYFGGIAGYNTGTVQNCFMRSTITTGSSSYPYPIVDNGTGTVSACFYANGAVSDVPYSGSPAPIGLANASDNTSVLSDNNGQTKHVLLSERTLFTDGDWNTLCLPFGIPAGPSGYSPIAGATVKELSSTSFSDGTLTLNFTDATNIEAGKPYLVKWNNTTIGDLPNPVFQDVTVSNTDNTGTPTTYADFVGCFSPVTISGTSYLYLGTKNTLYYPSAERTIRSCRAYFQLNGITAGGPGGGVRAFVLEFDDGETSGIVNAQWSTDNGQSESWFTLDGRRLNGKPSKNGIYINGGKKVVIN